MDGLPAFARRMWLLFPAMQPAQRHKRDWDILSTSDFVANALMNLKILASASAHRDYKSPAIRQLID
jgi:hypothetical protein